jgi:hypothetical protein
MRRQWGHHDQGLDGLWLALAMVSAALGVAQERREDGLRLDLGLDAQFSLHEPMAAVLQTQNDSAQSATPASPCSWPGDSARRTLARNVGDLAVRDEAVGDVVVSLRDQHDIPLSFIESDNEVEVTFSISQASLQKVLDTIVAAAPAYRYDTIAGHVVLYPRSMRWEERLEIKSLGPGERGAIASLLADQIERSLPAFPKFGLFTTGNVNSYVYRDPVIVGGAGSVVNLLAQMLGSRPSAVFSILKVPSMGVMQLFLGGVRYWQTLRLSSPVKLMSPGEEAQLKVIGALPDGGGVDLTAAVCGTRYSTSDEKLVVVTPDGVIRARGKGTAWVRVENGDQADVLSIEVTASKFQSAVPRGRGL